MAVTKKFLEACKIYPDFKGKKPIEVYGKLAKENYEWDTQSSKWVKEGDSEIIPLINLNCTISNALADDALELIRSALEEYGLEILGNPRVYPVQHRDKKGNLIKSETDSKFYFQIVFPELTDEVEDLEESEIEKI